jgi:hypothetical protein
MLHFFKLVEDLKLKTKRFNTVSILHHVINTAFDEYKSQGFHTNYDYQFLKKADKDCAGLYYAQTSLVPIIPIGRWLNIWFATGYSRSIHIEETQGT